MRYKTLAVVGAAVLMLTGCGSDGDSKAPATQAAPPAEPPTATVAPSSAPPSLPAPSAPPKPATRPPECNEPTVHPQVWFVVCGETGRAPGEEPEQTGPRTLGQTANTTGDNGIGTLELTPTTIVYTTRDNTDTVPERDIYVTVTIKRQNKGAVAAAPTEARPDGWGYTTPQGEDVRTGVYLIPSGFNGNADPVQPGTHQWGAATWSIRQNERGGKLVYVDGTGVRYEWTVPAQDSGPQIAEVKQGMP